jgi:hypothetical protein
MDDTMKEEKVGKKGKGMVLVISVAKPHMKNPEKEADPDTKEKMDRLSSENVRGTNKPIPNKYARMLAGNAVKNQVRYQQGDLNDPNYVPEEEPPEINLQDDVQSGGIGRRTSLKDVNQFMEGKPMMERLKGQEKEPTEEEDFYANIFSQMKNASFDVAKASPEELMQESPALREATINRLGMDASRVLGDDEEDQEAFARFLYGEGKAGADYQDMKQNPNFYNPEQRREFMRIMSQMQRQKNRADALTAQGQDALAQLREEDPTQFFADQDMVQRGSPMEIAWSVMKAKKRDPRLARAGVSGFNKPKRTPNHPKKSHIVVARSGGKVKTIRFGQKGAKTVTESNPTGKRAKKQKSFKARHAKNIARGPMSAAYWANKVKW